MNQSYRNLIASGIIPQLAVLDVYFILKAGAGDALWWKFILYALFFVVIHFPAKGWRIICFRARGADVE
jgi:hypothetical protein